MERNRKLGLLFKRLRWKNFLSTGNDWTEIDFTVVRTTLIVGSNGSGKSTMLDALCYALYGKPFRKINIPQLVNSINGKHLLVEVEFSTGGDDYVVRRGLKPNIFEVEKNGSLINQDASNRDYQDVLTKYVLKMNMKAFCQVVILGSASFVPFMQLSAGHRREILEDLLDIQIFTVMNLLLRDLIAENAKQIMEIDYEIDIIHEKIRLNDEHRTMMTTSTNELIEDVDSNIQRLQKLIGIDQKVIEEKTSKILELKNLHVDHRSAQKKLEEILKLENQVSAKIERTNVDLQFFHDHDNCPVCKQNIDREFKQTIMDDRKATLDALTDAIKQISTKKSDSQSRVESFKKLNDAIMNLEMETNILKNKVRGNERSIEEYRKQIEKISKKSEEIVEDDGRTKRLEDELLRLSDGKKKLFEEREVHKVASAILKDTGIKAKIIKQYIPIINKLINKYLSSMDFFVQFELDENFNETIKSRYRDAFSYASFSEGEKSKIDLALLFTWRTVAKIRNSTSSNLLILDEVFDGSIDSDTEEQLLQILSELSSDSNIFIISHRTDKLLDKFDRLIKFDKKSNFSMIVEDA